MTMNREEAARKFAEAKALPFAAQLPAPPGDEQGTCPTCCKHAPGDCPTIRISENQLRFLRRQTEEVRRDVDEMALAGVKALQGSSEWQKRAEQAEARVAEMRAALEVFAAGAQYVEGRDPSLPVGMVAPIAWALVKHVRAASRAIGKPLCEDGFPEIDGECACKPPETLADDPPRSVEEVLDATVPGAHVSALHGDPRRVGVTDRWSWSCRCGAGSKRADMTIGEAQEEFAQHAAKALETEE